MKPMISLAVTTGLIEAISAAGGDPDRVLTAVGLKRSSLDKANGFIPCATFARLLEEAAQATGDHCFGLHFGERFNPKDIGPLAYVALNSPTIAVADEQIARYLKLYNQAAQVSAAVEGTGAYLHFKLTDLDIPHSRQENEYSMVLRLNAIRMMVGSQWAPREVRFIHDKPENILEHERVFCAPVLFRFPTNNFLIDADFLNSRIPAADPGLYRIMKRYLEDILEAMPEEDGVLMKFRTAIAESIREGEPSLARTAKRVGVGPRTLQRQLRTHQIRFKKLADDTRRHFALNYLKDPNNTLTQIAFLLGYSEASAFNRAFKRWTGLTPQSYRSQATGSAARTILPIVN